jgi:hypothetical protein
MKRQGYNLFFVVFEPKRVRCNHFVQQVLTTYEFLATLKRQCEKTNFSWRHGGSGAVFGIAVSSGNGRVV